MERQDAYELMDTKIMDRIMKELWNSDIDISGHFLDQSTAYRILKNPGGESDLRFYSKRQFVKSRPHARTIRIWIDSIATRVMHELYIQIVIAFTFQWFANAYGSYFLKFYEQSDNLINMEKEGASELVIDEQKQELLSTIENA